MVSVVLGPSGLCEVTAHATCSDQVFAVASLGKNGEADVWILVVHMPISTWTHSGCHAVFTFKRFLCAGSLHKHVRPALNRHF